MHNKLEPLWTEVFIGLGSNLDFPDLQVEQAALELGLLPHTVLIEASSLYLSRPMGGLDQPPYINAVARLETRLSAHTLLDGLHAIENAHGRERNKQQWSSRTLDLDILLYGNQRIQTSRLIVPHPGISKREFVLYPLHELDKSLMIPGLGTVSRIIQRCSPNGLIQL